MENLNPVEVLKKLKEVKGDSIIKVFGDDYIAMTETVIEIFDNYGYEVTVNKK